MILLMRSHPSYKMATKREPFARQWLRSGKTWVLVRPLGPPPARHRRTPSRSAPAQQRLGRGAALVRWLTGLIGARRSRSRAEPRLGRGREVVWPRCGREQVWKFGKGCHSQNKHKPCLRWPGSTPKKPIGKEGSRKAHSFSRPSLRHVSRFWLLGVGKMAPSVPAPSQ